MTLVAIYPGEIPEFLNIERYISAEKRDSYDAEDFAGPDQSFPITTQAQLDAAAHLIGHAADPDAVKAKAIEIAKRKGFILPKAWQEDEEGKDTKERSEDSELHTLYMPISYLSRRDADEWIVEGQATAEVPDTFGTIFAYEASKKAFQDWINKYANVREMHGKKAAGKGLEVNFDDANKRVLVRTRVSKAEPGVWTKFHEGILNGFSVGAGRDYEMGRMTYQGKSYPAITRYNLAELSYVDAPSCPGSDAYIVARADGNLSDIIDDSEPEQSMQTTIAEEPNLERAGARLSKETQGGMHQAISDVLKGAKAMMDTCGCATCTNASNAIDPDNDGDVDWFSFDDPDGAAEQMTERMQGIMGAALERSLSPVYQRQQLFLARLAQFNTDSAAILQQLEELKALQGQLDQLDEIKAVLERMSSASTLDEVRAEMSAVKDRVKNIEDQPAPGGPVLNGARPYDKSSPYQSQGNATDRTQIERETIERLSAGGAFRTMEDQVAAAALLMHPVRMG